MTLVLILILAIALDYFLAEPPNRFHPLVTFGRWATWLESSLRNAGHSPLQQRLSGVLAWFCAVSPCLLALPNYHFSPAAQIGVDAALLYFCIGARSLQQHALAVLQALKQDDLVLARLRVSYIVSRQTDNMTGDEVRRAAVESVLENGADAVFAPLFWFIVFGPFGALLYRFSNTLDAMWGYKNQRYRYFGWAAARIDDVLNYLPARLTALSYALLGNTRQAWHAWRRQAYLLESPNGGPVMTAGAGALNLQLGGPAYYHGQLKNKPWFGGNNNVDNQSIRLAIDLVYRTITLWLITALLIASFI